MSSIEIGNLVFNSVAEDMSLLGQPVVEFLKTDILKEHLDEIYVSAIDPGLADTAEFCKFYDIGLDISANAIVVEAKRGENRWYAICNILATTRADINKTIRKHLDAKSASFASMDFAVEQTGMEYGGIGPIGAPADWPFIIDSRVMEKEYVIIGSGIRASKIAIAPKFLAMLPNSIVLENAAMDIV